MVIAVTGGAGFIGCNVCRYLADAGYEVVAIDSLVQGRADNLPAAVPLVVGDANVAATWSRVPDVNSIVHLSGASSTPMFATDLSGAFSNNVLGFLRILEIARSRHIGRVLYASSALVYGNVPNPLRESGPTDTLNFYALSKSVMENIAAMYHSEFGMECVGLRFMSIYGPREAHKGRMANLVSQFIWDIASGRRPVLYGDGRQTRDFTSVWDVAEIIRLVVECSRPLGASLFNVGTGIATSLNDLVFMLSQMMGTSVAPKYIPVPEERHAYNLEQLASLELAARELGYSPRIRLREGVSELLRLGRTTKRASAVSCHAATARR